MLGIFYLFPVLHFHLQNLPQLCILHILLDLCYYNLLSFPGNVDVSRALFLLTNSLAFLAASLARDALIHFSKIAFATFGFSSKKCSKSFIYHTCNNTCYITISKFCFSLSFKLWFFNFNMKLQLVIPSLMSSPCKFESFSFNKLCDFLHNH